jgi:transposase, IS30 family
VIGKNHSGALVTLAERASRYVLAVQVPGKHKLCVTTAVVGLLRSHKHKCHTLTFDNGKEFAEHEMIAAKLNADIYFAHLYHFWERGLNENSNGLLQQNFPKGMELTSVYLGTGAAGRGSPQPPQKSAWIQNIF